MATAPHNSGNIRQKRFFRYSPKFFDLPMLPHIKKPLIVKKIGTPEKKFINSPNMGMLSMFICANVCPYST